MSTFYKYNYDTADYDGFLSFKDSPKTTQVSGTCTISSNLTVTNDISCDNLNATSVIQADTASFTNALQSGSLITYNASVLGNLTNSSVQYSSNLSSSNLRSIISLSNHAYSWSSNITVFNSNTAVFSSNAIIPTSNNAFLWTKSNNNIAYLSGNVGIGTLNPSRILEVTNGATNTFLRISGGANQLQGLEFFDTTQRWLIHKQQGATNLSFYNGSSNVVTILNNGNVGIGTSLTNPLYKLQVNGTLFASTYCNLSTQDYLISLSNSAFWASNQINTMSSNAGLSNIVYGLSNSVYGLSNNVYGTIYPLAAIN